MKKVFSVIIVMFFLLAAVHVEISAVGSSVESMYGEGMEFFEQGDYDRAFARFQISGEVRGYAPSQNMLGVCYRDGLGTEQDVVEAERYFHLSADQGYAPAQENLAALEDAHNGKERNDKEYVDLVSASVGDYTIFGSYEQDNDLTNGTEPIEWRVLDVQDGKVLLISEYGLDNQPFNSRYEVITWEDCSLRAWLNTTFFNAAFSSDEQRKIVPTHVMADVNPYYSTDPGNDTVDKVYLLSVPEVENYFTTDSERQCEPTKYSAGKGSNINKNGNCWWWLRSPGSSSSFAANDSYTAAVAYSDGSVLNGGLYIGSRDGVVRPVLWVNPDGYNQVEITVEPHDTSIEPHNTEEKDEIDQRIDFSSISIGEYFTFGSYEQDNDLTNGKEPIEWRVLDVRDGKVLLISKYVLDCKKYNATNTQGTWESSSIRRWLNGEFINDAFSAVEQAVIPMTAVTMNNGIEPGNDTKDKIFLLSFAEVKDYFDSDYDRQCSPTMYAKSQGCRTDEDNNCWWWLRSRYLINSDFAGVVDTDGALDIRIVFVDYVFNFGARPALWVNLES